MNTFFKINETVILWRCGPQLRPNFSTQHRLETSFDDKK